MIICIPFSCSLFHILKRCCNNKPADNVRLMQQVTAVVDGRILGGRTTCICAWTSVWSNVCCRGAVLAVTLMSSWLREPADWARRTHPAPASGGHLQARRIIVVFIHSVSLHQSPLQKQQSSPGCSGDARSKSSKARAHHNIDRNKGWGLIAP